MIKVSHNSKWEVSSSKWEVNRIMFKVSIIHLEIINDYIRYKNYKIKFL